MKTRIFVFILLIALVVGAVKLVKLRKKQLESIKITKIASIPVATARVKKGEFIKTRIYFGMIDTDNKAVIKARISGIAGKISKREGENVAEDEILVELDGNSKNPAGSRAGIELSLKSLTNALESAKRVSANLNKIYKRDKMLYKNKAISRQTLDLSENKWREATLQIYSLETQITGLKEKLGFFTVKAPFNGTISSVFINPGDLVNPGQPLFTIQNLNPCKVLVNVTSHDIASLKAGTRAFIIKNNKKLECAITKIFPAANPDGTGTIEIRLDSPPFGLPAGASVGVRIETQKIAGALILPRDAVLSGTENDMVFAINKDKIKIIPVSVTGRSENMLAVKGKLPENQIVARGNDSLLMRLYDGTPVTPTEVAQ